MTSKAERLGRGASFGTAERVSARRAAIAAATGAPTEGVEPRHLPPSLISLNPDNPRDELPKIQEMAETFTSVGQITAITIGTREAYLKERPGRANDLEPGTEYVVIDGNRRLSAARLLGWETMPKVVIDDSFITTDERLLEAAFIANTQREDMTDLEEAEALRKLVAYYGSQHKAAARLGVSQGVISQRLSLLALTPDLQADLNAGRRKVEHVRNLSKLTPQEQRAAADERATKITRSKAKRQAPSDTASPGDQTKFPDDPASGSARSDYAVITSRGESTANPVLPAQSSVPAQQVTTRQDRGGQPLTVNEVEWAVGDTSEPVAVARDIAQRFGPAARVTIVSYLLSIADEEKKARTHQEAGA